MTSQRLRSGYTTGACATAAAKGAALMLREGQIADEVEITLPRGEKVRFTLGGQRFSVDEAACFVVKNAGDDPDVTNGAEVHVTVSFSDRGEEGGVIISGGTGIGRVTKPGLAVAPGAWAINPVPRRMITETVLSVFAGMKPAPAIHCLINIPNGEELARKTLNARLGIVGGLSILGTTGIVRPVSSQAWTDTIDAAISVALACGSDTAVLSTGRTSEMAAQKILRAGAEAAGRLKSLPEEAFVMMGDHVGHALRECVRKGVKRAVLAGQFAKLVKIACGHEQTHVSSSDLDLKQLHGWLSVSPYSSRLVRCMHNAVTARGVLETSGNDYDLIELVCQRATRYAESIAPGLKVKVLLAGYNGEVLYFK